MINNILQINLNKIDALVLTSYIDSWNHHISSFRNYLSEQEQIRATKLVTSNLKNKFIISHGLLRVILSLYTKIRPKNIYYKFNPFNKPYLGNNNSIEFNMSYSKDYVAFILSKRKSIGIDIEWEDPSININELKKFVFTKDENSYFLNIAPQNQLKAFYSIWVKKEATIKALGLGCSYNILNINTITNNNFKPYHLEQRRRFYYTTLEKFDNYSLAISLPDISSDTIIYQEICIGKDELLTIP